MTLVAANTRLKRLESWYTQFETNHKKILSLAGEHSAHEYFKTNLCDQANDDYFDRKGEFVQFIEDGKRIERENSPPSPTFPILHTTQMTSIDHQSLPKVILPKFHGLQSQWENLRKLFRSIVDRRTDLDPSVKYVHLRSSLSGETLERIPISAEYYASIILTSMEHFC